MEAEADMGEGNLSVHVGMRRRSASISDDYSTQKTNDDATECKYAAVKLNYYKDEFIKRFVFACGEHATHRDPEISRGYWARVVAVKTIVDTFIQRAGEKCQIINMGSGFDTLFWRLKQENARFSKFVDIDFSSVTAKKIRQIRKPGSPDLVAMFSERPREYEHADLHAGDYLLMGADLRQSDELRGKLERAGVDFKAPTLMIAECVLLYMNAEHSAGLLKELASWFDTAVFLNYEAVNMMDTFGEVMEKNLQQRGLALPGLPTCKNKETQKERFLSSNWDHVGVWTMSEIYETKLPHDEVQRIETIEMLDERELLTQLLDHYCIVVASKDSTNEHANLNNIFS